MIIININGIITFCMFYIIVHVGGAADRVINQILTEMDGMSSKKNVFIIIVAVMAKS